MVFWSVNRHVCEKKKKKKHGNWNRLIVKNSDMSWYIKVEDSEANEISF